ncbi:hypothetical protein ABEF91_008574 [Exophiala dermatitidis]
MFRRSLLSIHNSPLRRPTSPATAPYNGFLRNPALWNSSTPFSRWRAASNRPYQYQYHPQSPPVHVIREGPSRLARFARSVLWAFLFLTLGTYAASRYMVGAYFRQARVKLDSAPDVELAHDILDQIDRHPAVQALKADPEFEEVLPLATTPEITKAIQTGKDPRLVHHLVYTALRGSRGVFPRAFYCHSRATLVMVVGFSYGTEGTMGTLHNGALATMVHEALRVLAAAWFPAEVSYKLADLHMYFSIPPVSNGIYCIRVMPASTVADLEEIVSEHRSRTNAQPAESKSKSSSFDRFLPSWLRSGTNSDPAHYQPPIWPDWFDPTDEEQTTNTMIASVSMYDGHPLDEANAAIVHCIGRFEVKQEESQASEDSPRQEEDEVTP